MSGTRGRLELIDLALQKNNIEALYWEARKNMILINKFVIENNNNNLTKQGLGTGQIIWNDHGKEKWT